MIHGGVAGLSGHHERSPIAVTHVGLFRPKAISHNPQPWLKATCRSFPDPGCCF
jgi:hypothetical protein